MSDNTKQVLSFAVELGDAMLRNGAEVYRIEDTVINILNAYDIDDCDVYVLSNGIFASANETTVHGSSIIRHVPLGPSHLGRIAALNQLARDVCEHKLSIDAGWQQLARCMAIPTYSKWVNTIFGGIGAAGFSYLFGGSVIDAIVSLFIGMLLNLFLTVLRKHKTSKFMVNILGSMFVTVLAILALLLPFTMHYDKVIIGGIMALVPGIALTTSIRDIFNGDYLSGAIHLIDALLTSFCIAVGVGVIITICKLFLGGILIL